MEKRLNWIDNARGLGIILVIAGHLNCAIGLLLLICMIQFLG